MTRPLLATLVSLACCLHAAPPAAAQGTSLPGADARDTERHCFGAIPGLPTWIGAGDANVLGCAADSAGPWTAAWTPDGQDLFVSLFGGGLSAPNCLIVRLDAASLALVDTFQVGEAPEEIVFTTRPSGAWAFGFVTDSSSSTVSVFDPSATVVATIPIPFAAGGSFATAFPFGMAVSPDQSRVYVGTLDGSGDVHVIDARTHARLAGETLNLGPGRGFARMTFVDEILVLATTLSHPNFQGSTAEVLMLDPADRASLARVTLASSSSFDRFPSPQDVAPLCDGKVAVAGFDMGPRVFFVDTRRGVLLSRHNTGTSHPQGKFQGLGVSPDGLLAVADFFRDEIAWLDGSTGELLRVDDVGNLPIPILRPNELAFSPDGTRLAVPSFAYASVGVFAVPR